MKSTKLEEAKCLLGIALHMARQAFEKSIRDRDEEAELAAVRVLTGCEYALNIETDINHKEVYEH